MKKRKLLPVWSLILIDLFLIGAVLCSFAYFHHVRTLWGTAGNVNDPSSEKVIFTKPKEENVIPVPPDTVEGAYDYSGDFGKTLPEVFLKVGEEVISEDYTYISQDINMTLTEVNTVLEYDDKEYKVQYFVYDIYVRNIENLYTVSVGEREPFADLMQRGAELLDSEGERMNDGLPIAAVNGDYWGNTNHTQVAIRNGHLLLESDYINSDLCVLYYDGTMETFTPETYDWEKIAAKSPYQIWEFGPALLDENGKSIEKFSNDSYDHNVVDQRHPRSAIGYYEPGHYCFVTVDGRSDDSEGVRMFQLADIFEELGCKVAYNFDGGDSAQAYWGDECIRADQEREEKNEGQRELYDIVAIGEVVK